MHHLLAVAMTMLWTALNMYLWAAIESRIELLIYSTLLGIGYGAGFVWYASRKPR